MSDRPQPMHLIARLTAHPLRATACVGALFAIGAFVPFDSAYPNGIEKEITNALHFPGFFVLTLFAFVLWSPRVRTWNRALALTAIALTGLVLGTELIQPIFGREGSIGDIIAGQYGVILALLSIIVFKLHAFRIAQTFAGLMLVLGTATFARPLYLEILAFRAQQRAFPLLVDADERRMLRLWRTTTSGEHDIVRRTLATLADGSKALQVTIDRGTYSGVRLSANNQDWSGFDLLRLEINYDGPPAELSVRIDDFGNCKEYDSRFNTRVPLKPGNNLIAIPIESIAAGGPSRRIDIEHVRYLYLFLSDQTENARFTLRASLH